MRSEYKLGIKASTDLAMFEDWDAVAEDLEAMDIGQICSIYTHYLSSGEDPPRMRAESNRDSLNESLGERKDSYEMIVKESEEVKGGWKFSVRRVK